MTYLGREIWVFLTEEGKPGALYSVSGRSSASRQRVSVYYPEERRVAIEPLDKSQKVDPLRNYNAMRFNEEMLTVSNGRHTEDIYNGYYLFTSGTDGLRRVLNKWEPEPDSLRTPRVAGAIENCNLLFYLAIISENDGSKAVRIQPKVGTAYGLSTYSGKGVEPEPFGDGSLLTQNGLPKISIGGRTSEDIARFFVDKVIDPDFFVCCSTAIWNEELEEWELFVLNKNG